MKQDTCVQQTVVCEDSVQITEEQSNAGDKIDDSKNSLIDHMMDIIPELEGEEIASAFVFKDVTDKELPHCYFMAGNVLKWNDNFIPFGHLARRHCGEGPFKVMRDQSYLIAFQTERGCNNTCSDIKKGSNFLVLQNLGNQTIIIAHGSLFIEADKESIILG